MITRLPQGKEAKIIFHDDGRQSWCREVFLLKCNQLGLLTGTETITGFTFSPGLV